MKFIKKFQFFLIIWLILIPGFVRAEVFPNDPDYPKQWYLQSINAPAAWEKTTGSRQVIVAVLDTGVEVAHPDLINNIWINSGEIPFNNFDDDNNGYIDDIHGWDFIDDKANPGPDIMTTSSLTALQHGTIVASLIGSVGNNGTDGAGVNWQISLMPLRVLTSEGTGNSVDVAKAIDYAITKHANVINMSFIGIVAGEELLQAVRRAQQAGIVIVAAAGNDDDDLIGGDLDFTPHFPVCYDGPNNERWGVIGVAALDQNNQKAVFSGYGLKCVDISAPGVKMAGALVYQPNRPGFTTSFGGRWSGTSLAAPLVSGAAALLKSIKRDLSVREIYEILTKSADKIEAQNPFYFGQLGAGKLNLGQAVALLNNLYPQPAIQKLPIQQLLVYQSSKKKQLPKFFTIDGEPAEFKGKISVYNPNILPKNARRVYNKHRGKIALAQGDVDGDWEKEFITVVWGKNPQAVIWSSDGVKKGEMTIKGDYRQGLGLVVF